MVALFICSVFTLEVDLCISIKTTYDQRSKIMSRKSKEIKVEPSIFRVMVEQFPYKQIHIDFSEKEEALQYVHGLTSDNAAWYGVYELNPRCSYLISVEHNRLRPYDDTIHVKPRSDESVSIKQRRKTRPKKK